jgi:hypothetical protein
MLGLIETLAYVLFLVATFLVTAALMWAIREVTEKVSESSEWEPGMNPHSLRF